MPRKHASIARAYVGPRCAKLKRMDRLLYYDVLATYFLQDYFYRLPYMDDVAVAVTRLGDPRYCYVIIFPLIYWFIGSRAGYHVILAASLSEWCNIVLKWYVLYYMT